MSTHRNIILASSSPYRRELLTRLGLEFSTHSPDIDESVLEGESAENLVLRLSETKARAVAAAVGDQNALVIGSDQVADHDGNIVGKPANHEEAVAQLEFASGRTVRLCTGLVLLNTTNGNTQRACEHFEVTFRKINSDTIERYLDFDKPYNCCGSLRAEGAGISLLESLRGDDPNTLIGLPLIRLSRMLESEGVRLF